MVDALNRSPWLLLATSVGDVVQCQYGATETAWRCYAVVVFMLLISQIEAAARSLSHSGGSHMKAVVMAGGEGSRLRPLTIRRPKPMVPIAGKPVMEHILNLLKRHGITEVVVTVQYLASNIEDYFGNGSQLGMRVTYSREDVPLGTAGSVKNAEIGRASCRA